MNTSSIRIIGGRHKSYRIVFKATPALRPTTDRAKENFRKKINIIEFRFSYAFDEKVIILNDIIIDGKYNQKVNEKLNNIYFRGSDMQNKIFFKNMTNDLLKAYAG